MEESLATEETAESKATIKFLPEFNYYSKTYASTSIEDKKHVRVFRDYETSERFRRLQQELIWIKSGKVTEEALDRIIGKKRRARFETYENFAKCMLLWMSSGNR